MSCGGPRSGTALFRSTVLHVSHLLNNVGGGQSRKARIFRPARPIGSVTKAAGETVGLSTKRNHFRHGNVIVGMPIRREEAIARLQDAQSERAIGDVPEFAVVGCELEIGIEGVCPGPGALSA